jgi:hypothetical protein
MGYEHGSAPLLPYDTIYILKKSGLGVRVQRRRLYGSANDSSYPTNDSLLHRRIIAADPSI